MDVLHTKKKDASERKHREEEKQGGHESFADHIKQMTRGIDTQVAHVPGNFNPNPSPPPEDPERNFMHDTGLFVATPEGFGPKVESIVTTPRHIQRHIDTNSNSPSHGSPRHPARLLAKTNKPLPAPPSPKHISSPPALTHPNTIRSVNNKIPSLASPKSGTSIGSPTNKLSTNPFIAADRNSLTPGTTNASSPKLHASPIQQKRELEAKPSVPDVRETLFVTNAVTPSEPLIGQNDVTNVTPPSAGPVSALTTVLPIVSIDELPAFVPTVSSHAIEHRAHLTPIAENLPMTTSIAPDTPSLQTPIREEIYRPPVPTPLDQPGSIPSNSALAPLINDSQLMLERRLLHHVDIGRIELKNDLMAGVGQVTTRRVTPRSRFRQPRPQHVAYIRELPPHQGEPGQPNFEFIQQKQQQPQQQPQQQLQQQQQPIQPQQQPIQQAKQFDFQSASSSRPNSPVAKERVEPTLKSDVPLKPLDFTNDLWTKVKSSENSTTKDRTSFTFPFDDPKAPMAFDDRLASEINTTIPNHPINPPTHQTTISYAPYF